MDLGMSIFRLATGAVSTLTAAALWNGWRHRRWIDLTGEPGDDGLDDSDMVVCRQLASGTAAVTSGLVLKQLTAGPSAYDEVS